MARGGPQPGSGRKPSGTNRITARARRDARAKASEGGYLLPHEILLRAANGEPFKQRKLHITYYRTGERKGQIKSKEWVEEDYWPTVAEQIDAAKAAAPYYAPRLASQTTGADESTTKAFIDVMKQLGESLPG